MRNSTSSLLNRILAGSASLGLILALAPATAYAQQKDHTKATSAPKAAHSERAPARSAPAPRVERAAPVERTYSAPARVERTYTAPAPRVERTYTAPVPRAERMYTAPAPRIERAAPVRRYSAPAPVRQYSAPAPRVERRAVAPAPFVQRVPPNFTRERQRTSPFVQYVPARAQTRTVVTRRIVISRTVLTSPLVRAIAAARLRAIPVVYRPRYISGRVIALRRNVIVVEPPSGPPVIVREVVVQNQPAIAVPVGDFITLPVTYANSAYQLYYPPTYGYGGYAYNPYPANYGYNPYGYAPPVYCYTPAGSGYTAALLPVVLGLLTGNNGGLGTNDLAMLAASALSGGASCAGYGSGYASSYGYSPYGYSNAPIYNAPIYNAPNYSAPVYTNPVYATPGYGYGVNTPYDNCVWTTDPYGNGYCAASGMGLGLNANTYAPQQIQGVVVAQSGSMLMVLAGNGTNPIFVNAAPAMQGGYTVNGPVGVGQMIVAYGYYAGNQFVATSLL
jgi:hypothetical protein